MHAKRLVHKLEPVTDTQRCAQQHIRGLIWWFYAGLKACRLGPAQHRRRELRARFDRIFRRSTDFATLDRLLKRLHADKAGLLRVLDHPRMPLPTLGSENDIRCQVTKRAVSGGARSGTGRGCRDAFLGKACRKLGVAFWDHPCARSASPVLLPSPRSATSSAVAVSPPETQADPGFCPGCWRGAQLLERPGNSGAVKLRSAGCASLAARRQVFR